MSEKKPTREEAYALLTKYTKTPTLINHALTVEAVMRHFAGLYGEDPDKWGIIGLIHDIDYELYPEEHLQKTEGILQEAQFPPEYIRAALSHGWSICTEVKPEHIMEKVLFTIDELTGLIAATVYVRPSRSILDLKVKSVKKKWKAKAFAAGANREIILQGCEMLGRPLEEVIEETIKGMQSAAEALGLAGDPVSTEET